ncbi:VOC family protein [Nocardia yamanashiensis]|uniref:VOC family protein n=1 Tax=Nocardia yamanashiensis TaxID=209247 RepID=UPI001E4C50B4|nr:VOC family protein [Nocardia yamanashiensis]UGT39799.1 VOC family protein [Nocardia yamanashiensis]
MLTTSYLPGAPNWIDLGTPDVDAAAAFYGEVFDWIFQSAGPDGGGYGFFQQDGKTVAGIGPLTEAGAASAWTIYFSTPDADATAKAVEQAGGTVRVAPDDVFSFGRMGQFTDPTGADFAVWQPGDTVGMDVVAIPNTLSWTELYTTDVAAARDFYRTVFDWETTEMPLGAVKYTVVRPAGADQNAGHGGLMQLLQDNLDAGSTPEWHPYFEVNDCDATTAKAAAAGATTIIPPMDLPGVGRMAMFLDPAGAPFAVIKGATS